MSLPRPEKSQTMSESEHVFVSFDVPMNPDKLKEIARNELGETEELKKECFQQLRLLIREHGVNSISTDDFLLRFLRARKFNIERSFGALQNFTVQRTGLLKGLQDIPSGLVEKCCRLNLLGVLPYRDSKERLVFYGRPGAWNLNICSPGEMITVVLFFITCLAADESSQTAGIVHIYDMQSLSLVNAFRFIGHLKRWKDFLFNSVPLRHSSMHFVTDSIILRVLSFFVFPLLPNKLRNRIVLHKDFGECLHEYFPPDSLPDVLGGTYGPLDSEQQIQMAKDQWQKLKNEESLSQKHQ